MEINLHNNLRNKKQVFEPLKKGKVLMYNCGPTLYDRQHIGNLSMFIFTDILRRTLEYTGLKINQVINFTDFGHLSGDNEGDADQGEDRMSKGLKREGLAFTVPNMRVLAEKYAKIFLQDLNLLNVKTENTIFPFASDYIETQIEMIKILEEKSFVYIGKNGVYFDTTKFPDYGKLGDINLDGLKQGVRVKQDEEKRNPTDFLLWKTDPKFGWPSPWGLGFPGWHIECSAMIFKLLGEQIDIHTGGIEHIGVHHNNEIAQSESFTGKKPFSQFWLHRAHLKIDDAKIGKSVGNVVYLDDLKKRGLHPLSFRYLILTSHYKTPANFTDEAILGAQKTLENLASSYEELPKTDPSDQEIIQKFEKAIGDDLNTPIAISLLQNAKSKSIIDKMDTILGLNIKNLSKELRKVPDEILEVKDERDVARKKKNWQKSDKLREEIESQGFILEDKEGISKIRRTISSLA